MADGPFVLTAQIQLRGPADYKVIQDIRTQLGKGIEVPVNVKVSQSSLQALDAIKRNLGDIQKTSKGMKTVGDDINRATEHMKGFGYQSALALKRYSAFLVGAGGMLAVIRAMSDATRQAIEFDRQMVKLAQITDGSVKSVKYIADAITKLSVATGVASNELSKVADTLAQANIRGESLRLVLNAIGKTSLAPTFGSMEKTTEGVIAIMQQFQIKAGGVERALSQINRVAADFAVESDDIIEAVRRAGGAFAASGGQFEEFLGLFTSIRQTTRESAESIATGMRTILTRLQRGSTVELLKELRVQLRMTNEEFIGPYQAIEAISRGLSGLSTKSPLMAKLLEEFGGYRQLSKTIPLIQQFEVAEKARQKALSAGENLDKDVATAQEALAVQISKVREQFLALFRDISNDQSLRAMLSIILSLTSNIIKMADAIRPILPLLGGAAMFKMASAATRFFPEFRQTWNMPVGGYAGPRGHATGGPIGGSGSGDNQLILAEPGEFVIRKSSAQKLGYGFLRNLNRYADGGEVSKHKKIADMLFQQTGGKKWTFGSFDKGTVTEFDDIAELLTDKMVKSMMVGKEGKDVRAAAQIKAMHNVELIKKEYDKIFKAAVKGGHTEPALPQTTAAASGSLSQKLTAQKAAREAAMAAILKPQSVDTGFMSNTPYVDPTTGQFHNFMAGTSSASTFGIMPRAPYEYGIRQPKPARVAPAYTPKTGEVAPDDSYAGMSSVEGLTPAGYEYRGDGTLHKKQNRRMDAIAAHLERRRRQEARAARKAHKLAWGDVDEATIRGIIGKNRASMPIRPDDLELVAQSFYSPSGPNGGGMGTLLENIRPNAKDLGERWGASQSAAYNPSLWQRTKGFFGIGAGRGSNPPNKPPVVVAGGGGGGGGNPPGGGPGKMGWGSYAMMGMMGVSMIAPSVLPSMMPGDINNPSRGAAMAQGIQGAAGTAMTMGMLGMAGGPVGIAVTAVASLAMGIKGYTDSIKQQEEELRKTKLSEGLRKTTTTFEKAMATGKWTKETSESLITQNVKNKDFIQKSLEASFSKDTIARMNEKVEGGRSEGAAYYAMYETGQRKAAREASATKFDELKLQESALQDDVNEAVKKLLQSGRIKTWDQLKGLKDSEGRAVGQTYADIYTRSKITGQDYAAGKGEEIAKKEFDMQAKAAEIERIHRLAVYNSTVALQAFITQLKETGDALGYAKASVETFDTALEVIEGGKIGFKASSMNTNALRYSGVAPDAAISAIDRTMAPFTGTIDKYLGRGATGNTMYLGKQYAAIKSVLPGVLDVVGKQMQSSPMDVNMSLGNRLQGGLMNALGGMGIAGNRDIVNTVVDNIEKELSSRNHTPAQLPEMNKFELAEKATEYGQSFIKALEDIAEETEKIQQSFIDISAKSREMEQKVVEAQMQGIEQAMKFGDVRRQRMYTEGLSNTQYMSPGQAIGSFMNRQSLLLGGALTGASTVNVGALSSYRAGLVTERDNAIANAQANPMNAGAQDYVTQLQQQISNVDKAFENLAQSSEVLAAIQGRLGELEKERGEQFNIWMRGFGMTRGEQRKLDRDKGVLDQVMSGQVNINSLSQRQRMSLSRAAGVYGETFVNGANETVNTRLRRMWGSMNPMNAEQAGLLGMEASWQNNAMNAQGARIGVAAGNAQAYSDTADARQDALVGQAQYRIAQRAQQRAIAEKTTRPEDFVAGTDKFGAHVAAFDVAVNKLSTLKDMKMTGEHQVNVVINGADVLNQIGPGLQQLVKTEINNALSNYGSAGNDDLPPNMRTG